MTKVSAPYLYRKRGVYYLQKRIPKPLIPQYGRSILQRSLRTGGRAEAVRLSSQIVAALHREGHWVEPYKSPAGKVDYHTMGACWDVLAVMAQDK